MNKVKLFLNNFLVYGLSGIISKVIPLIMIPIITRIMPNTEYFGVSDMLSTILSFASALAIMGMYDAMYRMFFEKEDKLYQKEICSTAFIFSIGTSLFIFALLLILKDYLAEWFLNDRSLSNLIYITAIATLVGGTNAIVAAPTRMQNKRLVYVVMNAVFPIISYSISVPLLLTGHYLIALPLASMISAVLNEIVFGILNRKWFSFRLFKAKYIKPLLLIALPLLPNFIIYWIFESCDKLMITNVIGIGAEGVYSVGAKFGHASQLIYLAFTGGWQYFAFATMKEEDQVKNNSRIFEYLGVITFCCSMFMFALSEPVFKLLFEEEYHSAFVVAPYLFLAPLLLMLFQVIDNQFLVVKKTWPNFFILALGAGFNILLNWLFIPIMGIEGAAIATLSGYLLSLILCVIVLYFMKLITIRLKFYLSVGLIIAYILIWRLLTMDIIWLNVLMAVGMSIIIILFYLSDIKSLFRAFKRKDTVADGNENDEKEALTNEVHSDANPTDSTDTENFLADKASMETENEP